MSKNPSKTTPPEIIQVEASTKQVYCDGGDGALGHPGVYYTFDGQTSLDCGYCGRHFVQAAPKKTSHK